MPEHDPRLFFQVAAGLIPALIFGGLISEKLRPSPAKRPWSRVGMFAVPLLALFVLQAEVLAINVALMGEPDAYATWLVALVLVGLTAGALGVLAAPWYRLVTEAASRRQRRVLNAVTAVLSILLVVQSAGLLASAVQAEQSFQRLAAALTEADERDTTSRLLAL
jgi:MFS family permease